MQTNYVSSRKLLILCSSSAFTLAGTVAAKAQEKRHQRIQSRGEHSRSEKNCRTLQHENACVADVVADYISSKAK